LACQSSEHEISPLGRLRLLACLAREFLLLGSQQNWSPGNSDRHQKLKTAKNGNLGSCANLSLLAVAACFVTIMLAGLLKQTVIVEFCSSVSRPFKVQK